MYTVRCGGGIWGPIVEIHYGVSNDFKSLIVWDNENTEARSDYYEILRLDIATGHSRNIYQQMLDSSLDVAVLRGGRLFLGFF